jgi:ADA HAT complex component 1
VARPVKSPASSPLLQSRLPARSTFNGSQADPATLRGGEGEDLDVVQEQNEGPEPSPTNESNQAPSLIDDDEDYEVHSPTSTSTSEDADEGEVNFAVRDDDDFNHVELPQPESQPSCTQASTAQSPQAPRARARQPSAFRSQTQNHKEKHVTFVSENPGQLKTSSDRKRRKTAKG